MKFRSERDALVEMLATASRAVGGRGGSSPVLQGLLLTCAGNSLSVTGTDLDLTIQVSGEVIGIDDGSCVIPARLSTDIVRRLEPGAVTFADDGDHITINAARSTFKLQTYPVVEFPPVGKASEPTTQLAEAALGEAVRQVVRAASHDDGRPLLTGVLVSRVDGALRLVATDSYRMAMRDLRGANTLPGEEDLLVPARALSELQRLPGTESGGEEGTGTVGVAASASEITFWQGNVQISTRLLEGRYPDYKQLIPEGYPNRLHLGKESFLAALRRVQLLVRDNTTPVRLSMRPGGVDLSVQSQDVGDATESVDGDYGGEDLVIAFNPSYLIDGVEAVAGDEVIVETADASRAATVRGAEDDEFRYLLMPVRVS
ncbi:MAG TPA: DNA polymerase III subunit beta [Acidimicrobiales bacterium]|nr:DNA polymerase III subunit beta [Acidimicrobiales bacterium]